MNTNLMQATRALLLSSALLLPMAVTACGQQQLNSKAGPKTAASLSSDSQGKLLKDVPEKIETGARYLFYLHGRIIENEGVRPVHPQHGVYEYQQILETFSGKGFTVVSEARPRGTDVQQYAAKVTGQIRALIKAGVPPQHITVVGASKGGAIAVAASTQLKNRDLNFVLLAACGDSDEYRRFPPDLWGSVLSIYDSKDDWAGTCRKFFEQSRGLKRREELELKLGLGHGLLYRPLKEWVEPTADWARR